jgi:hypothetical protein
MSNVIRFVPAVKIKSPDSITANDRTKLAADERERIDIALQGIACDLTGDSDTEPLWNLWEKGLAEFRDTPEGFNVRASQGLEITETIDFDGDGV